MSKYKFNPLDHGYVSIDNFPELSYQYKMGANVWFIKIISSMKRDGEIDPVYWYSLIYKTGSDEFKIYSGSHDPMNIDRTLRVGGGGGGDHVRYNGVIPSGQFAKELLIHLFSPSDGDTECGEERYNMTNADALGDIEKVRDDRIEELLE